MASCEKCGTQVQPPNCHLRVTGWIDGRSKPAKRIVKDISNPHGYMCDSCAFDIREPEPSLF